MQTVKQTGAKAALPGFRNETELTELLALTGAARVRPYAAAAVGKSKHDLVTEPDRVAGLEPPTRSRNEIFTAYLEFERDLRRLSDAQVSLQKLLFGEGWPTIVDRPSTQGIYRVAEQAISNIVQLARQHFAPPGGLLEINQHSVLEAVGMARWSEEYHRPSRRGGQDEVMAAPPVDLDRLWSYLESTYGGDAGIQIAHRQNAKFIIKEFNLDAESEMKRAANSVSCFKRIYANRKAYGSDVGRYEFGHRTREHFHKIFTGLACAFEWSEMDQLAIELAPSRHQICEYDFTFKPRERASFTGLDVVFFKEQMEFKYSHAAAEKLMLYLGTYGQV